MARPSLFTHRKFSELACLLESDGLAAGHLEILWHAAYESGDADLGSADALERTARWKGEPGKLAAAMVQSGFIDTCQANENHLLRHIVHDLYDHAPAYVQRRMEREQERRKRGITISEIRRDAGRKGGKRNELKQTEANENHLRSNGKQTAQLPHPTPAPNTPHSNTIPLASPTAKVSPKNTRKRDRKLSDEQNAARTGFIEWWTNSAWPKKTGAASYPFNGRDAAAVKKIMECSAIAWDIEKAKALARVFLSDDDRFTLQRGLPLWQLGDGLAHYLSVQARGGFGPWKQSLEKPRDPFDGSSRRYGTPEENRQAIEEARKTAKEFGMNQ